MEEPVLEVKHVSKIFRLHNAHTNTIKGALSSFFTKGRQLSNTFVALNDISFNVYKGEALGLIGENGAGKSTLLRVLAGIIPPDTGEINFYGHAVSILEVGTGFNPDLTGRENIYLSASLYHFTAKNIAEHFDEIVSFSGIGNFLDEPVKTYSSGMYLRLAFSILTCLDADIYLIDEVINVGDARFQAKCKKRMEDLITRGKTLIIASHNMNEIVSLCGRIISLEKGNIVQSGNLEVIQKYMTQTLPQYFAFTDGAWYHMKNLQANMVAGAGINITSCQLQDYTLGYEGLNINHPFKIVFELKINSAAHYLIRLRVYEVSSVLIFVCSTLKNSVQLKETGHYKVVFEMPAHIFNETMYWIDFDLINPEAKTVLFKENKFITLKMSNDKPVDEIERRDYLPGVTKPLYNCEIVKL
jgi:ABC-type polysaccharide/polyol phosphate transport system ATPase subunit